MKEYRTLPGVALAANRYWEACSAARSLDLRENKGGPDCSSWRDAPNVLAVTCNVLEQSLGSFSSRDLNKAELASLARHYRARIRCLRALIRLEGAARGRAGHFMNRRGRRK